MNFSFCAIPLLFAHSAAQKWKGKVRQPPETLLSPAGFLKKREPRVPETAVHTQLGFGQLRSGSGISINRRIAAVLFFLLLKPSRNAWRRPCIGAFPFQLSGSRVLSNSHFDWNLKRAFKWFTGRIKT
jgi:hypothetical protein